MLTKQNYLQYGDLQYILEDGLVMGAPTSSVISKIYLKYLENTKKFDIPMKIHILGIFQYVDKILTVCQNSRTNIHEVPNKFNNTTPTMHFTMEVSKIKPVFYILPFPKTTIVYSSAYIENPLPLLLSSQTIHTTSQNTNWQQLDI
jgi:hypothetical protein